MSSIIQRKPENFTARYHFTSPDDEIIDDKFLQLSDDVETWLYRAEGDSDRNSYMKERLSSDSHNDSSSRSIDSRTYTRRKRSTFQPSLDSCWELDVGINTPNRRNVRSSLGLLTPSLFNKSQNTDLLQGIVSRTPVMRLRPETDSSDCTGSEAALPKRFQLDLSCLTPIAYTTNEVLNTTFNIAIAEEDISDLTTSSFGNIIPADVLEQNSLTTALSTESLEYNHTDINNLTNGILNSTYGIENIAPKVNLNSTTDKTNTSTKTNLNTTLTFTQKKTSSLAQQNVQKINGQVNLQKLPLNTSFPKSQLSIFSKTLNNTFTKSVDALNGIVEDDQTSSASDSSFSSCGNLPRSVGDLHDIARLQEESLEERETQNKSTPERTANGMKEAINGHMVQHVSTPKSNRMNTSKMVDEIFSDEQLSPIRKSGDDGNLSDHSVQSSGSSHSTYSSSSRQNNTKVIPKSVCSLMGNHKTQLPATSNIYRPRIASGLRMPASVSHLPGSRIIRPPTVHATGTRSTSALVTSIPRPASRLPAPRFRGRTIPKQNK